MTRQILSTGASANDGTGDTLRQASQKINENFVELYQFLGGGDSNVLSTQITLADSAIVFEGSVVNDFETRLAAQNPSADRLVQIPNASGMIVIDTHTQTLTNKTLTTPTISSPKITTAINDANSNELVKFTSVASAVNEITITNAATGNSPSVVATGTNTNINLLIDPKGTGSVELGKTALSSVEVTSDQANYVPTSSHIICNKASALAINLDDGTTSGEMLVFTNKGAGVATVTPDNFAQGTSFALAQYDGATVIWDGTNWYLVGNQGEVTVS